jgi:hypothetical protein
MAGSMVLSSVSLRVSSAAKCCSSVGKSKCSAHFTIAPLRSNEISTFGQLEIQDKELCASALVDATVEGQLTISVSLICGSSCHSKELWVHTFDASFCDSLYVITHDLVSATAEGRSIRFESHVWFDPNNEHATISSERRAENERILELAAASPMVPMLRVANQPKEASGSSVHAKSMLKRTELQLRMAPVLKELAGLNPDSPKADGDSCRSSEASQSPQKCALKPLPGTALLSPSEAAATIQRNISCPGSTSIQRSTSEPSPTKVAIAAVHATVAAPAGGPRRHSGELPPPPPPPPPTLLARRNSDSAAVQRRASLTRKLHWRPLGASQVSGLNTIWADGDSPLGSGTVAIDEQEITSVFRIEQQQNSAAVGAKASNERQTRLPVQRANNMSIVLAKLQLQVEAVLGMLEGQVPLDAVSGDVLDSLLSIAPTRDEIALVGTPPSECPRSDLFVYRFGQIPLALEKLQALRFFERFDSKSSFIRSGARTVCSACSELQGSAKLRRLLKLILHVGNTLNQQSARGFRLDVLVKLMDTKGRNGATLLTYLVQVVAEKHRDLFEVWDEVPHIEDAARVPLEYVSSELAGLRSDLQVTQLEVSRLRPIASTPVAPALDQALQVLDEDYFSVMQNGAASAPKDQGRLAKKSQDSSGADSTALYFELKAMLDEKSARVDELVAVVRDTQHAYEETCAYFAENAAIGTSQDFFGTFTTFLTAFRNCKPTGKSAAN